LYPTDLPKILEGNLLKDNPEQEKRTEASKPINSPVSSPKAILVIDDEAIIRDLLKEILEDIGVPVFFAETGEKGMEIFRKEEKEIALVLLDVIMPGMDGREVYYEIKNQNPDVKIIITSGYSKTGVITELMEAGVDGYIQKPFQIDILIETINRLLQK